MWDYVEKPLALTTITHSAAIAVASNFPTKCRVFPRTTQGHNDEILLLMEIP